MTHAPQLQVYKASAGSGKTFTLAVQYIKQLLLNPHAYRHILAVTFTNKATAEMKERILGQLYGLSRSDAASESYMVKLREETGLEESAIREAAGEALKNIIHDYSRFRIETIDSFFQSVMRNLARELELGANLTIELRVKEVISDAVDQMIEKLDRKSPVLNWLIEYIEERIEADRRWNVAGEIKSFGLNIFDEEYMERGKALRKKLEDPQFIITFRKEIRDLKETALTQMAGFREEFENILEGYNLTAGDLSQKERGVISYFRKISSGNLTDEVCNTIVEKCLADEHCWAPKSSPRHSEICQIAKTELMPLLQEAENFRKKNNYITNSCTLALQHLNKLQLLTHIDYEVHDLNHTCGRFMLSDTNALLHELIHENDASFVYEKIGTTIDTVMIDEFQDTSRLQWENFRLLLRESLSQKEGSLIVGDIKQSIYRWRNGDWKILANIGKDKAFNTKDIHLSYNFRSEARIVEFNNAIFEAITQKISSEDTEGIIANAYSDVRQATNKTTPYGYAELNFLNENDTYAYPDITLHELATKVDSLISKGIMPGDIAILVRKNKNIPIIADYFDKHTPYKVVSDEAFRLDASCAICMIIDAIRFLAVPDDRIALGRLAVAYQHDVCHNTVNLNTILIDDTCDYLPQAFTERLAELRILPLYELTEQLYTVFNLDEVKAQDAYLCAFYDAVTEYLRNNTSELTAFLDYWDEILHEKPIASGEIEGIRIISIHKSKGLEFHTVLLPFCDWKMENETNNHLIWCAPPQCDDQLLQPFSRMDLLPVNYSAVMEQSIFRDSYQNERRQLWIDSINLLYVAFTRARCNLIVWCKSGSKGTISALLENVTDNLQSIKIEKTETTTDMDDGATDSPTHCRYMFGEILPSAAKTHGNKSDNPFTTVPKSLPIHIESLRSKVDFRQSNRSATFCNDEENENNDYVSRGLMLHNVFASIRKATDLNTAIEHLKSEGVIEDEKQAVEIRQLAERALNHPQAKAWYDGSYTLYNEQDIIFTATNGQLQTRRPDRVMIKDGKVTIVDFKFGKKKDVYREQVKEYMQLIEGMGFKETEGYLWYVYLNEIIPVR